MYLLREGRRLPVGPTLLSDLDGAAADGHTVVLVGSLGPVEVGFAVAHLVPTVERPIAMVTDLYVEPEARGVGLGRMLMDRLVDWAVGQACIGIDAEALPGDRATKNFFEGFGLVARKITVHRVLEPDG